MTRKTFDVDMFVKLCNYMLEDDEFFQRDKELICCILEEILKYTDNRFTFTQLSETEDLIYNRQYQILQDEGVTNA